MDPVPAHEQTWTFVTWMAYWATDVINLGTWETASSIIAVGLTWRDAIPIMFVGTFCVAVPMVRILIAIMLCFEDASPCTYPRHLVVLTLHVRYSMALLAHISIYHSP